VENFSKGKRKFLHKELLHGGKTWSGLGFIFNSVELHFCPRKKTILI
jgi:hypothetical protein